MKESAWEKSEELNLRSASILTQEAKRRGNRIKREQRYKNDKMKVSVS